MNNKAFIQELSRRTGMTQDAVQKAIYTIVDAISERLQGSTTVNIANFGTFEVKKRLERIVTIPATGQRMLVPPKLLLNFRPAAALKDWVNSSAPADGSRLNIRLSAAALAPVDHGFATTLFTLIADALTSDDHSVKVRGLGTFKTVDTKERESVSIASGQRITISSRRKVTFLPDPVVRDLINKPFSQFEAVALNEGVDFADHEDTDRQAVDEPETDRTHDDEPRQEQSDHRSDAPTEATDIVETESKEAESTEAESTEAEQSPAPAAATNQDDDAHDADDADDADDDSQPDVPRSVTPGTLWVSLLIVIIAAAMFCLGYYGGMHHWLMPGDNEEDGVSEQPLTTIAVDDSLAADTTSTDNEPVDTIGTPAAAIPDTITARSGQLQSRPSDSNSTATEDSPALARARTMVRLGAYTITGTQETITVRSGQTMRKIAKYYFGEGMECYIQVHNNCTEVTEGMTLNIPSLRVKARSK